MNQRDRRDTGEYALSVTECGSGSAGLKVTPPPGAAIPTAPKTILAAQRQWGG